MEGKNVSGIKCPEIWVIGAGRLARKDATGNTIVDYITVASRIVEGRRNVTKLVHVPGVTEDAGGKVVALAQSRDRASLNRFGLDIPAREDINDSKGKAQNRYSFPHFFSVSFIDLRSLRCNCRGMGVPVAKVGPGKARTRAT